MVSHHIIVLFPVQTAELITLLFAVRAITEKQVKSSKYPQDKSAQSWQSTKSRGVQPTSMCSSPFAFILCFSTIQRPKTAITLCLFAESITLISAVRALTGNQVKNSAQLFER